MKKFDLIGSFIWIALGIGLGIGSIQLKLGGFHKPGPGLMPFMTGGLLALFGFVLMFSSLSKGVGEEGELIAKKIWVRDNWKSILFTLLALFGYALLLEILGFPITTFLFFFFLFALGEPRRWVRPLIFSGVASVISHLIFCLWLKIVFPRGIFGF
jgi:putative tricarboxylic transport membrane protein